MPDMTRDLYVIAHSEGKIAYEQGENQSDNPYLKEEELEQWSGWNDGWLDGMYRS
jgi:hypothetical protein